MARHLKFKLKGVTSAISNAQYTALRTDASRERLGAGTFSSDSDGNVDLDVSAHSGITHDMSVMVVCDNYNGSNGDTFNSAVGVAKSTTTGGTITEPTSFSKIVFLGDSIFNASFANNNRSTFVIPVTENASDNLAIVEEATAGDTVEQLEGKMDAILARHTESDTQFVCMVGRNNLSAALNTADSAYTAQTQAVRTSAENALKSIIDKVHATSRKIIISSMTFSAKNGSPTTDALDNDPATRTKEQKFAYGWTKDFIVPIMREKTPKYLIDNNWPALDLYTMTRNFHSQYLSSDNVHPSSEWGETYLANMTIQTTLDLLRARFLEPVPARNFNVTPLAAPATDVVVSFDNAHAGSAIDIGSDGLGTPHNINWLRRTVSTSSDELLTRDNLIDATGNATTIDIRAFTNTGWSGGGNAGDTSTSLTNDALLKRYVGYQDETKMVVQVKGLEPSRTYNISVAADRNNDGSNSIVANIQGVARPINISSSVAVSGHIANADVQATHTGEAFIVLTNPGGSRPLVSGVRIRSAG